MARFETFDEVLHAVPRLLASEVDLSTYLRQPGVLAPSLRAELDRVPAVEVSPRPRVRDHRAPPGRGVRLVREVRPLRREAVELPPGEYDLRLQLRLSVASETLAGLYDAHTIPHELPGSTFDDLLGPGALRSLTTGIPEGVSAGDFHLTAAPSVESVANVEYPILVIPFRMDYVRRITAPTVPGVGRVSVVASLSGTLRVMVALAAETSRDEVRLTFPITTPPPIPGGARLEVAPDSPVQPILAGALDDYILDRDGLLRLGLSSAFRDGVYLFAPTIKLPGLDGASLRLQGADLRVQHDARGGTLNVGLLLGVGGEAPGAEAGDPSTLVETLPRSRNVVAGAHSSLIDKILRAAWASGRLQRTVDEAADDFQPGISARVRGVRGEIDPDGVKLRVDLRIEGFCAAAINVVYALDLTFAVRDGEIEITRSDEFQGIGGWEVLLCAASGLASLGVGLVVTLTRLIALGIEAIAEEGGEPAPIVISSLFESPLPVPGTELRPQVEVAAVQLGADRLTSSGMLMLLPDTRNAYVYAQFLDASTAGVEPISGSRVRLWDLDRPAPARDDVTAPEPTETQRETAKRITTVTTRYTAGANEMLREVTTDSRGRVQIVLTPTQLRTSGGVVTTETITEYLDQPRRDPDVRTTRRTIQERRPDLYFTLTRPGGAAVSTQSSPIVNVAAGQRVGTAAEPLVYRFGTTGPVLDPGRDRGRPRPASGVTAGSTRTSRRPAATGIRRTGG